MEEHEQNEANIQPVVLASKFPFWHVSIHQKGGGQTVLNRIAGKSVHARAFAHKRLQSPVSYEGIDMLSRTILKTMYRTISN